LGARDGQRRLQCDGHIHLQLMQMPIPNLRWWITGLFFFGTVINYTAMKVTEVKRACGDSLVIFGGLNGHFFLEELQRGARGTMPGSDMMPMFVRVWNDYEAGRHKEARAAFNRHLPLIRFELQPGLGVSAMKHNLKALSIIKHTTVRPPTRSLDDAGIEELKQLRSDPG
jgi:4-hydroxy-tetrahydrodipicolinate synthase